MIQISNLFVTLPAAKAQFETKTHTVYRILVKNYDFFRTTRDLTRISLQFISVSHSCLLAYPIYLLLSIKSRRVRYNYCRLLIRGLIDYCEKGDLTTNL